MSTSKIIHAQVTVMRRLDKGKHRMVEAIIIPEFMLKSSDLSKFSREVEIIINKYKKNGKERKIN